VEVDEVEVGRGLETFGDRGLGARCGDCAGEMACAERSEQRLGFASGWRVYRVASVEGG
jgi:hypothetical protein